MSQQSQGSERPTVPSYHRSCDPIPPRSADVTHRAETCHHASPDRHATSEIDSSVNATSASVDHPSGLDANDALTGVMQRAAGVAKLQEHWARSIRHGEPLSCIVISIDGLRGINERLGVGAGDQVLIDVARLLRTSVRAGEQICRMNGNEFLLICPHAGARAASVAAERHRWAIQNSAFQHQSRTIPVTVSVGVAERTSAMSRVDDLIAAAVHACNEAGAMGGNRARVYSKSPLPEHAPIRCAGLAGSSESERTSDGESSRSALVIHDLGAPISEITASITRLGLMPTLVSCDRFSATAHSIDEAAIVITAVTERNAAWPGIVRSIRSAHSSLRVPILVWAGESVSHESQRLLGEGADAFVCASDAPHVMDQVVRTLQIACSHQRQLHENQAMRAEQARMLSALFDLTRAFASADTLERCLDRLVQMAGELLRLGNLTVLVSNRDRSGLWLARRTEESTLAGVHDAISMSAGLIGKVCTTRESMLITDMDEHQDDMSELERTLINAIPTAIAPMVTSQRVAGVLIACARSDQSSFHPWELAMLDLLSNIAAAAIDDHHSRTARDEAREAIVVALAKLTQHRDGPTAEHVDRVARVCVALARELGRSDGATFPQIDDAFITNLEWAVPLHDIGKVGLPDHILLKPGRLTDEEMQIMRSHVEIGQSALHSISMRVPEAEYLRMAEQIAHSHHEWFDGTGYPMGLKGEEIPLAARIASVADAYDAITSSRVYKSAVAHESACEEIRKRAGTQFDPRIVQAFVRCMHMFAGASCEMNSERNVRADAA